MAERLFILDAHSLIYQVFHAIPEMTGPNGMPTNAVFGFVRDIQTIRRDKNPDYLVCAIDSPGETFRHAILSDYKAKRAEMPDDLRPQIPMILKILEAFRIPILAAPGLEADDFLASVAVEAGRRQIYAYLCTADKDVRQVISDYASVYDLRRHRVLDRHALAEDWGITPEQVVDYQALVGDSVDNVAGIAGVGPKTASKLLNQFGTLEGIYEHIDEVPGPKLRENLLKGRAIAMRSREVLRLKTDVTLPDDWSAWRLQPPDVPKLLELFAECGFHRFADEIRAEAPTPASTKWHADYRAVTDEKAFASLLKELANCPRFSFDLETTSVRPTEADIVGIACSWKAGEAYYIAVDAPPGETALERHDVLERLRPILENPEIEKVGQNLKYDMTVLKSAGYDLAGVAFDSMVASYLLDPGERNHNLDELSRRWLQHETIKISELIGPGGKGKPQLCMNEVPVAKVAEYAGEDADVAWQLTQILEPALEKEGLLELFRDLECPLIEVLADMETAGIRVDLDRLAALSAEFGTRLDEVRRKIYEMAGREFNLDSPVQLRELLFHDLKLPVIKRTKSGPSTDQDVLEELGDRHPICALLLDHRRLSKLKGTYLDALPHLVNPRTGRIHASFNQTVAATGRLSASDPNLQNIPVRTEEGKQIRQAFLPGRDDQVLLAADYSQIELRLLAHFSGDANLKQAFLEDLDIHAAVAAQIQGVDPDQVDAEMRRRAKAVNFGIMYGLSPFGLAKQLKIGQDEAAAFIDEYFRRYPTIESFFTQVLESAKRQRYVSTILGRKRPISGIKNTTGRVRNLPERTAINAVIQGSAADLIKKAMVALSRRLRALEFPARMLLQIHDELVFEVDADRAGELAQIVAQEMTQALTLDGVPLKVDVGVGPNWLDLEPLEASLAPR